MSKHTKKNWHKIKEDSEREENTEHGFTKDELDEEVALKEEVALDHLSHAALEEQLTLAEQKAHENWEKATYAIAELENVRKRADKMVADAHRYGLAKIITDLLPVVDSLEQALKLTDKEHQEGLTLTMDLFLKVLQKYGVEQLDPQGLAFNPQEHEAMSLVVTASEAPNTVLEVFQKGYKLNERLIRPARVIVAKGN